MKHNIKYNKHTHTHIYKYTFKNKIIQTTHNEMYTIMCNTENKHTNT
jgi:hypothetical protein